MANTIKVTACDNELIIIAYQSGTSYELCRILSGHNNQVNVTLGITAGNYTGTSTLNYVNAPLNLSLSTCLPAGSYSLLMIGVNWGGPTQFNTNVNGTAHNSSGGSALGDVWNSGPIAITV